MPRFRTIAAAALGAVLAGCMSAGDFADRAVEHNKALALAADRTMLLNVVRAANRRPIVYSRFTGVSESFSRSAGASASIPVGADASSVYGLALSAGPTQIASLSTAPLDDQEFYQGVMRPVPLRLLAYYLDNGWPPDLLYLLAVERIEIGRPLYQEVVERTDALCAALQGREGVCAALVPSQARRPSGFAGRRLVFRNDPGDVDALVAFHDVMLRLQLMGLAIDSEAQTSEVRLPAAAAFSATAEQIAAFAAQGAEIRRVGDEYVIRIQGQKSGFRIGAIEAADDETAEPDLTARLRSPDAMLYYLGEVVRAADPRIAAVVGAGPTARPVPVFSAEPCGDDVVSVDFEGACWGVPRDGDHRSMQVIALMHQLFALNKRASEPPGSGIVRTVN